jgi:uncharacterized protein DUF6922
MAIITKKIGKREYAYLVSREGKRVVHRYLGAAHDPKVERLAMVREETASVPARFRTLFWDTALENIDLKSHARYVMEKVLEFGDLDAFEWLRNVYPGWQIKETLLLSRNLSKKSRNFWTIWFGGGDA